MMPTLAHKNITLLPVLHGRLEFAGVVRTALLANPPELVAVELPGTWQDAVRLGVNRLPYLSLAVDESAADALYLPIEPTDPLIEALRTAKELALPTEFIDLDTEGYPLHREPMPDSHAVYRLGYAQVVSTLLAQGRFPHGEQDEQRETMMAHALQQLAKGGRRIVCVLGLAHVTGVLERLATPQPRPLARTKARVLRSYNWAEKSAREHLGEAPFLAAAYEHARTDHQRAAKAAKMADQASTPLADAGVGLDREAESERMLRTAAAEYAVEIGCSVKVAVTPHQFRLLGAFSRKYARVEGMLVPDLYQLVVAARGMVDDTFARLVWEQGTHYPWQDGSGLLPSLDLEERFPGFAYRGVRLRQRRARQRPRLRGISDKHRATEHHRDQWKSKWSGRVICSHVPEDLIIENFGRYLQQRARGMLAAERTQVEPFLASTKDGLDLRETLRNWHAGRLFVQEVRRMVGDVGSVVVIFDEDTPSSHRFQKPAIGQRSFLESWRPADNGAFPWMVTWLGENDQESDMALYATEAGEQVVGPGISRCVYGGFVMSYPPQRMVDVWADPVFDMARTKAERLLLAGLDYSEQRYVAYVAEKPPRAWFRGLATRLDKQLVYIPIGQIPRNKLTRIRTFHVLEGHSVRGYASEYID